MASIEPGALLDFAKSLESDGRSTGGTKLATVVRVDGEQAYVKIPGGVEETPVATSGSVLSVGDTVSVSVQNGKLRANANVTNPSAGILRLQATEKVANTAYETSVRASEAADFAEAEAVRAGIAADSAQASATAAQTSATQANTYANSALTQLAVVEDVIGTVNWITEHGTYELSSDTTVDPDKIYYTRTGSGTTQDPYIYTPVADPTGNPRTNGYYELNIDSALSQYVASHLALTDAGLYVVKDDQGYKLLLSNSGMVLYDSTGTAVATYGQTATIGVAGSSQFKVNAGSLQAYDSSGDLYFQVSANGLEYGDGITPITTDDVSLSEIVVSTVIEYAVGTSSSTAPSSGWSTNTPVWEEGKYVWMRTTVTYADSTAQSPHKTVTTTCIQGADGASGGRWYTGTGITGTSTTPTVFSGSGVSSAVVGDMYLNTSTSNTYRCTLGGNASTAKWAYVANIEGDPGSNGLNQATVYLYNRAASASRPSSGSATYTFSTGVLSMPSGWTSAGWSQTFPAETQGNSTPVWIMIATASSSESTVTLSYTAFSTPVKMVSSGTNGTDGADGKMLYATCSTSAGTQTKAAYLTPTDSDLTLYTGLSVTVQFSNANTHYTPKLNLYKTSSSGLGAKDIYINGSAASSSNPAYWRAGAAVVFVYDGTEWKIADNGALTDASEAAMTATNYIREDSTGIRIANANPDTASTYQHQTATSTEFVVDNVSMAEFGGSGARLGDSSKSHMQLDYRSMTMVDRAGNTYLNIMDMRESDGKATITETFEGDGSTTEFTVHQSVYEIVSVKIDGTATSAYSHEFSVFTFDTAPADGSSIEITYKTYDSMYAFTFGTRDANDVPGRYSFSEGQGNKADGDWSFASGYEAEASGDVSHAEGRGTVSSGSNSHAEGQGTTASGTNSHAEGNGCTASGNACHAGGLNSTASGGYSFAHGASVTASDSGTAAFGIGTTAGYAGQMAVGIYNENKVANLFEIGNGLPSSSRSNAFEVDVSGNVTISGSHYLPYGTQIWDNSNGNCHMLLPEIGTAQAEYSFEGGGLYVRKRTRTSSSSAWGSWSGWTLIS